MNSEEENLVEFAQSGIRNYCKAKGIRQHGGHLNGAFHGI